MIFPVYSEQMRPRAFLVLFREVSSGSLHWSQMILLKFFFAKTSGTRVLVHGFLCKTQEAMKGDLDLTRSCSSYHILSICRVVCIFKR